MGANFSHHHRVWWAYLKENFYYRINTLISDMQANLALTFGEMLWLTNNKESRMMTVKKLAELRELKTCSKTRDQDPSYRVFKCWISSETRQMRRTISAITNVIPNQRSRPTSNSSHKLSHVPFFIFFFFLYTLNSNSLRTMSLAVFNRRKHKSWKSGKVHWRTCK